VDNASCPHVFVCLEQAMISTKGRSPHGRNTGGHALHLRKLILYNVSILPGYLVLISVCFVLTRCSGAIE